MFRRRLNAVLALGTLCPAPLVAEAAPAAVTVAVQDAHSYSQPMADLSPQAQMDFTLGRAVFRKLWVSAPSSTQASDGLGPLHNARACRQCHVNNGRGRASNSFADPNVSMVARLSLAAPAAASERLGVAAHPALGTQLQQQSVAGLPVEGDLQVRWRDLPVSLNEEPAISLREPVYELTLADSTIPLESLSMSFRIASPLVGLGWLDRIEDQQILAWADPDDRDGNGISGRVNRVFNPANGSLAIGRFGWKAGQANLAAQNASAANLDLGLSNPLYPDAWGDCAPSDRECRARPDGNSAHLGGLELAPDMFSLLNRYVAGLAVPAARAEPEGGRALFLRAGCGQCHRPGFRVGGTEIAPYSDLLLHDMGEALADQRREFAADGREWRTAPLWGIGLAQRVNPGSGYLHDGRARTLLEAVLWHGGEAQAAKLAVQQMSASERRTLITFLESL